MMGQGRQCAVQDPSFRVDLSLTSIHNGFAPVSRLYRACITLYRGCIASLTQPVSHVSQVYRGVSYRATIAPLSRHYRATIAPVSRVSRLYRECRSVKSNSRVSRRFAGVSQIRGYIAVYRGLHGGCLACIAAVSRCIAGLAEEDSHVSRLSREYRGCFTRVSRSLAL